MLFTGSSTRPEVRVAIQTKSTYTYLYT
jgi:hypothetical protein